MTKTSSIILILAFTTMSGQGFAAAVIPQKVNCSIILQKPALDIQQQILNLQTERSHMIAAVSRIVEDSIHDSHNNGFGPEANGHVTAFWQQSRASAQRNFIRSLVPPNASQSVDFYYGDPRVVTGYQSTFAQTNSYKDLQRVYAVFEKQETILNKTIEAQLKIKRLELKLATRQIDRQMQSILEDQLQRARLAGAEETLAQDLRFQKTMDEMIRGFVTLSNDKIYQNALNAVRYALNPLIEEDMKQVQLAKDAKLSDQNSFVNVASRFWNLLNHGTKTDLYSLIKKLGFSDSSLEKQVKIVKTSIQDHVQKASDQQLIAEVSAMDLYRGRNLKAELAQQGIVANSPQFRKELEDHFFLAMNFDQNLPVGTDILTYIRGSAGLSPDDLWKAYHQYVFSEGLSCGISAGAANAFLMFKTSRKPGVLIVFGEINSDTDLHSTREEMAEEFIRSQSSLTDLNIDHIVILNGKGSTNFFAEVSAARDPDETPTDTTAVP